MIHDGHEVTIIDDFSTGSEQNLWDLDVKARVIRGDLGDRDLARDSLKNIDTVYHFAAEVGSVQYLHGSEARELFALQSNLLIDTNVFRAAVENDVKTIIYASSVSVYPKHLQMTRSSPFREEDSENPVEPEGGYGWSKYLAEKQLGMMSNVYVGIARIFHAYGKNIYLKPDKSQVIGSLMRKAIRYPREDFVVWGDGSQKRCFVYIEDVIDALVLIQEYVSKNSSITVNLGSQEEVNVRELAEKIISLSGKKILLKFDRSQPTGVLQRVPSLDRIGNILGWKPTTPFDTGLKRTYEWALKRIQNTGDSS
jgi:GDP-D-mannose 3', 5'-epimerase